MQQEAVRSPDRYIHISITSLFAIALVLTPLAVLTVGLRYAPVPVAGSLAFLVLLVLALQHRRARSLTNLTTLHEQALQLQQTQQQSLLQRLAELQRREREDSDQRIQAQDGFHRALKQARHNTATALTQVVTMRDPITGTHLERLSEYVAVLANHLAKQRRDQCALNETIRASLPGASMLHDIGKVGIPDAILQKPARLSAEEFAVIQRHPTIGGRTLERLCILDPEDVFLRLAHEIALHHHERWDGSGYPFSLSQEQIPLSARIVAVADVYDALTSERPYKRAYSHDVTRGLIIAQSRSHFDPLVVEAFLAREVDFKRIREAHAEVSGAVRAARLAPVLTREEDAPDTPEAPQTMQPKLQVVGSSGGD